MVSEARAALNPKDQPGVHISAARADRRTARGALAESTEAHAGEILDEASPKWILATKPTSVTYAADDQTARWGALLLPAPSTSPLR
jgi:hypothetical protein